MIRVLLVEDDANLSHMIKHRLERLGDYMIERASDGEEGLRALVNFRPDIVVTDLEMNTMDGNTMVSIIREKHNQVPVIVLTGRSDLLIESGANTYLTKPFDVHQLDLNIKSLIKTIGTGSPSNVYKIGKFIFEPSRRTIKIGEEERVISPTASRILEMLCRQKGESVARNTIIGTIWGVANNEYNSHNLDVQIDKLRKVLKEDPSVSIESIRSTGIILRG